MNEPINYQKSVLNEKMDPATAVLQLKSVEQLLDAHLLDEPSNTLLQSSSLRADVLLKSLKNLFHIEKSVVLPSGLPQYSKTAHFFTDGLDAEQIWSLLHAANHELLKPVKKLAYKVCATDGIDRSLFALTGPEDREGKADAPRKPKKLKTKHKVTFADDARPLKGFPVDDGDDVAFDDFDEENEDAADEFTTAVSNNASANPFKNRSALPVSSVPKKTPVDDKFFHLQEMDQYLQWVEERGDAAGDAEFDVFADVNEQADDADVDADDVDDDDSESETAADKTKLSAPSMPQYRYDDFFDELPTDGADGQGAPATGNKGRKSAHEQRQVKINEHVRDLEAERLEDKEWHLRGEIQARERPENSVLEKFVEFEHMTRSAPVITELTTRKIENLIRQRIKDQIWDNVERKVKPAQVDAYEFKKRLLLDQEKPKQSLAQIYEQDYLKKASAEVGSGLTEQVAGEANNPAHSSIRQKMKTLFEQLDALSNFTFAPRPVAPEIKLQPAAPAYEREEVNVLAVADSNVLAPEELHRSQRRGVKRSELTAPDERTETDRKRELRKKKLRQSNSAHTKTAKTKEDEQDAKRKAAKHAKFTLNTSTQFFERLQKHVQKEVGEKKTSTADGATQPTKKTKKVTRDGSNGPNAVALKFG